MSSDENALEGLLLTAWDEGRARWPGVALEAEHYVRHVVERLEEGAGGEAPRALLARMALMDLYLTGACLQRVAGAVEVLDEEILARLPGLLHHLKLSWEALGELRQEVGIHLLVAPAGGEPRLALYRGRGPLLSWVYVIALRRALKQRGGGPHEVSEASALELLRDLPAPEADPERELIQRRYRQVFKQAVQEALGTLSAEQRYLLRLSCIDGLSTTQLGRLFGKDQSTMSRWLKTVREVLYTQTRRRMTERLRLDSSDFSSILGTLRSQLDVSLGRFLRETRGHDSASGAE